MEKFMLHCMREDRNDVKTEPFALDWKIENLSHWTREAHGDCFATSVNFDGSRVEFKVYPQCADDGRMEVHFPEELSRYQGLVTIRISKGRYLSEGRKEQGQRIVCLGPQMERFRRNLNSEIWERLVFFFVLEDVGVTPRCEYASTVLQPVPHLAASQQAEFIWGNNSVIPQCAPPNDGADTGLCLIMDDELRQLRYSNDLKLKELHARRRERILAHRRERFLNDRLVPSLASLSLGGKAPEELNQLSKSVERVEVSSSMSEHKARLLSQPGGATVWRRRLGSYPQRQPVPPNGDDISIPTGHPTLEQLIPGLGRMSISREVKESPSSSDPPEGHSAAIASPQCDNIGSSRTIPDVNYRIVESSLSVYEHFLKSALDEIQTPTPLQCISFIDFCHDHKAVLKRHELMDCRYNPY